MDYEEKVQLGRDSYEAFNRGDLEALLALYDSECEWHLSRVASWPEKRLYRGHEGLTEFFNTWLEPWDDFYIEIIEGFDLPDDRAFAIGFQRGRGRLSGAAVELPPFAQIIEFRGGRILRVHTYSDVEEGRRAAGLAE